MADFFRSSLKLFRLHLDVAHDLAIMLSFCMWYSLRWFYCGQTGGSSNRQKEHKKAMPLAAKRAKVAKSREVKKKKQQRAGKQFRGRKAWKWSEVLPLFICLDIISFELVICLSILQLQWISFSQQKLSAYRAVVYRPMMQDEVQFLFWSFQLQIAMDKSSKAAILWLVFHSYHTRKDSRGRWGIQLTVIKCGLHPIWGIGQGSNGFFFLLCFILFSYLTLGLNDRRDFLEIFAAGVFPSAVSCFTC